MNCTSKPKTALTDTKLIETLRDIKGLKLEMKLNDYKLNFDEIAGDWKSTITTV